MPGILGEHAGVAVPALVEAGADEFAAAAASGAIVCTVGIEAGGPYVVGAAARSALWAAAQCVGVARRLLDRR